MLGWIRNTKYIFSIQQQYCQGSAAVMSDRNARGVAASYPLLSVPLLLAANVGVQAQETSRAKDSNAAQESLQEVIVTGSRIARPDLDRLGPHAALPRNG